MDKKIFVLNIIIAVVDTIIAALAIVAFTAMANIMGKWWIVLFALIPLMLFNHHTIVPLTNDRKGEEDAGRESAESD